MEKKKIGTGKKILIGVTALFVILFLSGVFVQTFTDKDILITGHAINVKPIGYEAFSDTTNICGASIQGYKDLGASINSAQQQVLDSLIILQETEIDCTQGFNGYVENQCHMEYIQSIWQTCLDDGYDVHFSATTRTTDDWLVSYNAEGERFRLVY